jgi:hypothetical protein
MEFSTVGEDITRYEIVDIQGKLAIFSLDTTQNTFAQNPYNTRDPFIASITKNNTISSFALHHLSQKNFGQNMLVAYVFEAASTPQEQVILVKKLFFQISRMYREHPEIGEHMKEYMTTLSSTTTASEDALHSVSRTVERLFGTTRQMYTRLDGLTAKLQENKKVSVEDIYDMGIYALPFNVQYLAQRMQFVYRIHEAS